MSDLTDRQLIAAIDHDERAFQALVARHHAGIHRYLARRVGADLADDLAAETFFAAFRQRARFDRSTDSARPWLFGIATNELRRHARREARQLAAFARTGVDPIAVEPDHRDPIGARLADALRGLRQEHRDVLFLSAVADLSHDEIGDALGVPVATVRTWLHRARTAAQRALAGTDPALDPTLHPLPSEAHR